jgi:hypothetical protein
MVRFPYEIRYSLSVASFTPELSPKWHGTASVRGTGPGPLGDHPTFVLRGPEYWRNIKSKYGSSMKAQECRGQRRPKAPQGAPRRPKALG